MTSVYEAGRKLRRLWQDTSADPPLRPPTVIQFPVNDICNSRCQMCYIWEQKRGFEVSADDVRRILSDPLFRDVAGVGFNGGEPTLRADLADLVAAVVECLPSLQHVSLITNGIREQQVLDRIREVRRVTLAAGVLLDVMVSLDGVGEVHDTVRGRKGNFQSATSVLEQVGASNLADQIRVGCTITQTNACHAQELLEWCIEHDYYARFRVAVPHDRLYNRNRVAQFMTLDDQVFAIAQLLSRLISEYEQGHQRLFYKSLLDQLVSGTPRRAGCSWRNQGVTLFHDGHLGYCAVESPKLGSTLETSATSLYRDNLPVLESIRKEKCGSCLHDYTGASDFGEEVAEIVKNRLPKELKAPLVATRSRARDAGIAIRGVRAHRRGSTRRGEVVLITGWYGTETIGDQAILGGLLGEFVRQHDGPIAIASMNPYITRRTLRLLGFPAVDVWSYSEAEQAAAAGWLRAAAMGGGPVMGTIPSIGDLARLHTAVARSGARTGLLGVGVGPLGRQRLRRRHIRQLIAMSDVITTRDVASTELARRLGARVPVATASDPAMGWFATGGRDSDGIAEFTDPPRERPRVGLALREWPIHEYGDGALTGRDTAQLYATLSDFVSAVDDEYELVPMPMGFLHVGGDDRRFLRTLLGPRTGELRLVDYPTPDGIRRRADSCDLVVSMRFHGAVAALATGTRVVAIDYTMGGKVASLGRSHPAVVTVLDPTEMVLADLQYAVTSGLDRGSPVVDAEFDRSHEALRAAVGELLAHRGAP